MQVRGEGGVTFAAVLLLIAGTLDLIYGIAAISEAHFAIGSLLGIAGAYPFWSLGIFALCVICIHGLVIYGEDVDEARAE